MNNLQVSIIIVNYNTKELLKNCLKSIYEQTLNLSFEIIISDNGSTDGSIEMLETDFPSVLILKNGKNLGFGAANNRALDIAKGKYIFFLNSDTILLNNAIKMFYDYFESHESEGIGALGSMLLDSNQNFIHSGDQFPSIKSEVIDLFKQLLINLYLTIGTILKLKKKPKSHIYNEYYGPIDYISGADMFLKNNAFARFDEDFFLYFEETYLQYLMAKNNLNRYIINGPKIIHLCGGSIIEGINISRKASVSRINYEFSRIKFLRKISQNNHISTKFIIAFCKFLILLSWSNPFIIKKTHVHFKTLLHL